MIPSFRYQGGKARLRRWLLSLFPHHLLRLYAEPFAGRGNVFWAARGEMQAERFLLNDLDGAFFRALLEADLEALPAMVTREDFEGLKVRRDPVATLLEPRVTFGGKGYQAGYNGGHPSHVPYTGKNYRKMCTTARQLLLGAEVSSLDWEEFLHREGWTAEDFIYFDPPYYGTSAPYPQIDHSRLIEVCNAAPFLWALSGYDNPLYQSELRFVARYEQQRNAELKSAERGEFTGVTEVVWTNYIS